MEIGYATLPRGNAMRIPSLSLSQFSNGHIGGGGGGGGGGTNVNNHASPPQAPIVVNLTGNLSNGSISSANGSTGGRAVHDGFATIRSGGSKRGRARSSPSVVGENRPHQQCHHGCCPTTGRSLGMEPLWEEKGSLEPSGAQHVTRRDRQQLPWWEIATRRSRYRSCPAFSQASVVNALEQTMSSVTNRLERLASSPDLKESEAAELRKTAAVLRQQSSAVCQSVSSGYLPMERQLSCDSVSSVTSTVSGASLSSFASMASRTLPGSLPQHYGHNQFHQTDTLNSNDNIKVKKRSWLRSSFRRAFGRHGRKRTKQQADGNAEESHELPMHHAVNSAVRNITPPPPYCTLTRQRSSFSKESSKQKAKDEFQSIIQGESELVARLQKELADKERELTDCRLEMLSAQHQLQSQADTISRLQGEVTGLREENSKLLSVVGNKQSPSTDTLIAPLSHTFTALTLNPKSASGNNAALVHGRQVKVMVVEQPDLATAKSTSDIISVKPSHLTHIGNINVESKTTWEEFDRLIANTVKDYGNRIDPVSALGLESDSILCYRVDDVVRAPEFPLPELLPYGYCVGHVDALHVWLKGGNHKHDGESIGDVSLAAFSSVTPTSSLKRLASQLIEHRRLLLAGPPACGKSSLAQALAQFFIINSGREYTTDAIKTFKVTGTNTLELCQLLNSMWPRSLASSSLSTSSMSSSMSGASTSSISSGIASPEDPVSPPLPPSIIIIDDLHAAGGVVETLQRCLPTSVHIGPAIIATSCSTAALATRLHINCNFKWASLSIQQEPVRGLLGRVLRRRVVAAEVAANTRLPDAHHLAEWLTRLWLHLNTLLSGHCSSHDVGVGPGLLMDSPLGQEETQVWFTEVWNTRLVPYIKETIKSSSSPSSSMLDTWTDPLDWVLATYPWPVNAACGPDQLVRITAGDIGKQDSSIMNRKLSPSEPYVPLSVRQQIRKAESIYSTPQLIPLGPLGGLARAGGVQGTGQTILTTKEVKTVNPYQPIIRADEEKNKIYQSIISANNDNSNIYQSIITAGANKAKNASTNNHYGQVSHIIKPYQSLPTSGNTENGLENGNNLYNTRSQVELPEPNLKSQLENTKCEDFDTVNKTSMDNCFTEARVHAINDQVGGLDKGETIAIANGVHLSKNDRAPDVLPPLVDAQKQDLEVHDVDMESEPVPADVGHSLHNTYNGQIHSYSNVKASKDTPMEMDLKENNFNPKPEKLDVLAKNAINSNGIAGDCVKIIRETGSKSDLRGISNELTSTFKPAETAM